MQTALSEGRICDKPGGIQARRGPTHEHGQETVAGIARELGVKATLLQTWRRNAAMESKAADAKGPISCKEENRRLRREKAPLREDREILKKSGRVPSRTTVSTNGGSCAECALAPRQHFARRPSRFIPSVAGRMVARASTPNFARAASSSASTGSEKL